MTAKQDGYASAVIAEGQRRGISPRGIKIAIATTLVESNLTMYANSKVPASMNLPHDAVGSDGFSVGLFQQQVVDSGNGWWWGDAATCMDPTKSAGLFYDRLAKLNYNDTSQSPGSFAQAIQQSAFPDRYDQQFTAAGAYYNRLAGNPAPIQTEPAVTDPNRPDFNEYWRESPNSQDREGTKVDLFLLHTNEGDGNADSLAGVLDNPASQVSYHYTISTGYPNDDGVTVCDIVDTDLAAWSVLDANNRSINLCFAGSFVSWSHDDWVTKAGRAIDVAAYLAVQDCIKYNIPINIIGFGGTYSNETAGIADHAYVTDVLKIGTHTDVGPNFPREVFAASVSKYAAIYAAPPVPAPTPSPTPAPTEVTPSPTDGPASAPAPSPTPVGPADDQLTLRWNQLGGQTLVEAVAEIRDKVLGTTDRSKEGAL